MRPLLWKQRWCRRLARPSRRPGGTPAALTQQVRKAQIKAQPGLSQPTTLIFHCPLSAGVKAKAMIKQSRESVARLVGGQAQDIIFTSGGTEVCTHQADVCSAAGIRSCFMSD